MTLRLDTAPAEDPVTLAEVKAHLNISHTDDDTMLAEYIDAAVAFLDGRDGFLGRALITQTWTLTLPAFPAEIVLPLPPCQSVSSITYTDTAGATQTVPVADYEVSGLNGADPARIVPAEGKSWPNTKAKPEAVTVTFVAGYGAAAAVPGPIKHAIKEHVTRLYENREMGSHKLADDVAAYRLWSF